MISKCIYNYNQNWVESCDYVIQTAIGQLFNELPFSFLLKFDGVIVIILNLDAIMHFPLILGEIILVTDTMETFHLNYYE